MESKVESDQKEEQQVNEEDKLAREEVADDKVGPIVSSARNKEVEEKEKENLNEDSLEIFCFKCKRLLAKSKHLINVTGRKHRWHAECFYCDICQQPLDHETSCHIYKDQIVCRNDYIKLQRNNSVKCSRCRWPIGASDWVRKAASYVYHLACFSCDICQRQLNTGEQFTIRAVDGEGAIRLMCRLHFAIDNSTGSQQTMDGRLPIDQSSTPNDFGGSQSYDDTQAQTTTQDPPFDLTPSNFNPYDRRQVHHNQLVNDIAPNGATLNQDEHCRYSNLLTISNSAISGSQGFHSKTSATEEKSIANQHQRSTFHTDDGVMNRTNNSSPSTTSNGLHMHHRQHHSGQQSQQTGASSSSTSSSSNSGLLGSACSKSKRVRTTFTEDQLSILQTHFQIDSNPDGQDLERIATITGLSKRVTQVWFQNSRARQKKYLIKRKPISSILPGTSVGGAALGQSHQFAGRHPQPSCDQISTPTYGQSNDNQHQQQPKWSATSDHSELSPTPIDDFEDDSQSSSGDDQLIVTDNSND